MLVQETRQREPRFLRELGSLSQVIGKSQAPAVNGQKKAIDEAKSDPSDTDGRHQTAVSLPLLLDFGDIVIEGAVGLQAVE